MDASLMKALLESLAWAPHSAYHHGEVKRILAELCPDVDLTKELAEYVEACLSPPGPGSPK